MLTGIIRGRGHPHVAAHRKPHTHVAGDAGEHRSHEEEDRPAHPLIHCLRRQEEENEEDNDPEDGQGLELPVQIRRGTLLDRSGDLLHARGALTRRQHLAHQEQGHEEGEDGNDGNDDDREEAISGQFNRGGSGGHESPWVYASQRCRSRDAPDQEHPV